MCNTCCNSWNTWANTNSCGCNACNSCGCSLFDILFRSSCACNSRCRCNSCGCNGNTAVFTGGSNGNTAVFTNGCNGNTTVLTGFGSGNSNNGGSGCGCRNRRVSVPITGRIFFEWPFAQTFAQTDGGGVGNGNRGTGNDDFDAYYARQYGLFPFNASGRDSGCGCGN